MNGKAAPNSATHAEHPDIVPFIVTYTGDVIPVGFPVFNKTYISSRLIDSNGQQSTSYPLAEAIRMAYGTTDGAIPVTYKDMPLTMIETFNNLLPSALKANFPTLTTKLDEDSGCKAGTFSCMVKIDENLDRRY